jgi:hypothetical protein
MPFDRQHVSKKFPRAETVLINRPGAAVSRQRATLSYRERHHAKLGQDFDAAVTGHGMIPFETMWLLGDPGSDPDSLSPGPHGSTRSESQGHLPTIQPLPKPPAGGKPFRCPYCYIVFAGHDSWAIHILDDLLPYSCVSPECSTPGQLFPRPGPWYDHMLTEHWVPDRGPPKSCPLCGEDVRRECIATHICRHLEELARFALPPDEGPGNSPEHIPTKESIRPEVGGVDTPTADSGVLWPRPSRRGRVEDKHEQTKGDRDSELLLPAKPDLQDNLKPVQPQRSTGGWPFRRRTDRSSNPRRREARDLDLKRPNRKYDPYGSDSDVDPVAGSNVPKEFSSREDVDENIQERDAIYADLTDLVPRPVPLGQDHSSRMPGLASLPKRPSNKGAKEPKRRNEATGNVPQGTWLPEDLP